MMMAMQTCQHYSERMSSGFALNEYEQQMYEALARLLRKYSRLQKKICSIHMLNAKKQYDQEERAHQEWLERQIPKVDPTINDRAEEG